MDRSLQTPRPDDRTSAGSPPLWPDLLAAAESDTREPILDLMRPREERRS